MSAARTDWGVQDAREDWQGAYLRRGWKTGSSKYEGNVETENINLTPTGAS